MASELYERIRFRGRPRAHPGATIVRGNVRFTVLTSRLLRLEWAATGEFEDRSTYAFPTRYAHTAPQFTLLEQPGELELRTDALVVRYQVGTGKFTPDNLSVTLQVDGDPVTWRPGTPDSGNLFGTRRTLDRCAGDAPLESGLISRDGWALFDDTKNVVFDDDGWVGPRPEFPLQDWYFFGYGHDYLQALREYVAFGGGIPLIPRFVLGGWWSRYWAYSEGDLRDLVSQFEAQDVPLDVFVIDMDWHTPHSWTGYTWNRELFPDPPAFLHWLHDKGLRVTLNLHPAEGIQPFEEVYPAFAQAMAMDPEAGEGVPFRIADKTFVKHYFELIHHKMEDEGVDFWWMDWQQGEISEVRGLDPLPWINHLHFNDIKRRGVRPMLYSRWGGLGNHRYHIGFSGDTFVGWDALQFQPFMTATASNVLYGWWSHDIGGHMGGATEPELYARWVQFGAVSPVLRLHSTKDPRCERRPWAYPEPYAGAAKEAFQLRYRLVPYLYTMGRVAVDTGISLCRPMYYVHPDQDAAYAARYQYYLGDNLIVAPIVFPADPATGLAVTDVWVPEGTWVAYDSLETFKGPRWVRMVGDIHRIPMLVRSGGILPLAPGFADQPAPALPSGTTDAQPQDELVLAIFPGEGTIRVYRDDGVTNDYQSGQYEWLPVHTEQTDGGRRWRVRVLPVEGRCAALPDRISYRVELCGCRRPTSVSVDDREADWHYADGLPVCIIEVPDVAIDTGFVLNVAAKDGIVALDKGHNQAQRLADVAALGAAGALCKSEVRSPQDLIACREALGDVAFRHAVARLGGPFFHGVEFVTPAEAAGGWGRITVGAPADGEPMDVEILFVADLEGAVERRVLTWERIAEDLIVDVPFAFEGMARRGRWSAMVTLTWRGIEIAGSYISAFLFPSITTWRAAVYDPAGSRITRDDAVRAMAGQTVSGADASTGDGMVDLSSGPLTQDPLSVSNFNEPFVLPLWELYAERLASTPSLAGYFLTTCTTPVARDVILELWCSESAEVTINGQPVVLLEPAVDPDVPSIFLPPLRTAPFRLETGANQVMVHTRAPDAAYGRWFLGGRILTLEGDDIVDLSFT